MTEKTTNWMRQSFLKMIDSKTEIVIFGTCSQCNKITTTAMEVGETSINISPELTYLGVLLDQNLTLKSHILTKAKRVSCHLDRIRQIVKFLDLPAKQTLILSLVMSNLDYSNVMFINLPSSSIYPMQWIQNQGAKLIMNKHWLDSPTIIMRQLHWLPIRLGVNTKCWLYVYRCMKDQAPEYLQQKLTLRNPVLMNCLATECNFLHIPYNRRKTLADHWFSSAGPRLWNTLLFELQTAPSLSNF